MLAYIMSKVIKIKRGLDIKLKGKAEKIFEKTDMRDTFALKPTDFSGLTPKLTVKVDDKVKAGSPLFFDKNNQKVLYTSPVSGKVSAINRGERRRIMEVVVEPDDKQEYEQFMKSDPTTLSREEIIDNLLKSGIWPAIRQRPYGVVANPEDEPKSIFISAFDSAPLGPDYDFIMQDQEIEFQIGINALKKLTKGKIHLGINDEFPPAKAFANAQNVQQNRFQGKHPAGNVGVQIHHVDPINKGDIIWTVKPQDVVIIGRLFNQGIYDASTIVALAGSEVLNPRYYKTIKGTCIKKMVEGNVTDGFNRYISGNVLSGTKISSNGYLGFYDSQITIIPEGNHYEFIGWAKPGFDKYSNSRAFFSWLSPNKEYRVDTNYHGGERAFVMTGQYEKVCPMDIYPVQLLKSILVEDIDQMEQLGIYEVVEEDFALCEFVCTSKIQVQQILRSGLEMIRREMS
jgi:Na+-transporting NADH:ubiquinone oxidoreductase subunit A